MLRLLWAYIYTQIAGSTGTIPRGSESPRAGSWSPWMLPGPRLPRKLRITSCTGLAWYCPLFFMVKDCVVVAKELLTANPGQLVAWGSRLAQIFIIGLLSLRPWRGVLGDQGI